MSSRINTINTADAEKAVRIFEDNLEDGISERGRKIVVSRYRVAVKKHLGRNYLDAPLAGDAHAALAYVQFNNIDPRGEESERFHHECLVSYFDADHGLIDTFDASEALGYDGFVRAMLSGSVAERQAEIRSSKRVKGEPTDGE